MDSMHCSELYCILFFPLFSSTLKFAPSSLFFVLTGCCRGRNFSVRNVSIFLRGESYTAGVKGGGGGGGGGGEGGCLKEKKKSQRRCCKKKTFLLKQLNRTFLLTACHKFAKMSKKDLEERAGKQLKISMRLMELLKFRTR